MQLQAGHFSKAAQCVDWTVLNSHRNLTYKEAAGPPVQ